MSKTVLGRSLGALLGGRKPAGSSSEGRSDQDAASDQMISAGLRTLLKRDEAQAAIQSAPLHDGRFAFMDGLADVPAWYFFGADLLLLALAAFLVLQGAVAPGPSTFFFAGIAVATGALLSIVPLVRPASHEPKPEEPDRWFITRDKVGETERVLIIRAHDPLFIAEVQHAPTGRITVLPLPLEGDAPPLSAAESQRVATEAIEAYRSIIERRAKEFRATLR